MFRKSLILTMFVLMGCATTTPKKPTFDTTELDKSLIGAVTSIEKSIRVLAEAKNAMSLEKMSEDQKHALQEQVSATPNGLAKRLTFKPYYGELEPIVRRVTKLTNYDLVIDGKKFRDYVMVKTHAGSRTAYDILRDLGAQAGKRATVYVIEHKAEDNSEFNGVVRIVYKGV